MKREPHDFLAGGGEAGALMRAMDWSATALGSLDDWPQSLRTSVSTCLNSRFPILIWWGSDLAMLYNDAYRPILGDKHPHAMGQAGRECWPEIWHIIGPMLGGVLERGEATWSENQLLPLERHGFAEECYFTFSYSPIRDETGIAGVFCAVTETTGQVLAERRLRTLRDLAARAAAAKGEDDAWHSAIAGIRSNPDDLPAVLLYRAEPGHARARLMGAAGVEAGSAQAPLDLEIAAGAVAAPFAGAQVLPLCRPGSTAYGFMVVSLSARRPLDAAYRDFLGLAADHVATGVANARAYEEERRRAEALAELDRAKTAFFSNVSHEFRTPLTLMLGPVEDGLADREEPLTPAQRMRLELVQRSGLRLQKLVNSLLDFSRLEAGRVQASYVPLDLAALTADLASSFRSAIEKAGLQLKVDCPPLPEPAYVDRDMWEKIVLNLLSNAFKFTFEGRISLALTAVDGRVELVVRDTGTGIPAAELANVFERFRRVEGARSRTHEGTGIGLALVQELARLHGGAVKVASVAGEGSTFTVTIPAGRAHLPAERIGGERSLASTALGARPYVEEALHWLPGSESLPLESQPDMEPRQSDGMARARIVWADDNADMREYVRHLLSTRYEVEAVADGEAALAAIRARRPDLLLADVMMPKLDGLALVRALRAEPSTRALPAILLSARAGEDERIEGFDAGANDYLYKPFGARELLARVSARIELGRLQAQLESERTSLADLFAQTPVPTAVLRGPQLVFEMANPAYAAVVGGRKVVGKPFLEALPELEGQGFDDLLHGVMRTGIAHVGQETHVKLRRGGGIEDIYFNFICAPLRGAHGDIDGAVVVANDVTEQVLARKEVERLAAGERARSEELAALLDAVPAVVWIARDPECRSIIGSRSAHELLRIPHGNLSLSAQGGDAPRHFSVYKDGVELAPHELPVQAAAKGAEVRDFEEEVRFKDGSSVHLYGNAVPLLDAQGTPYGAIGAFLDISAHKRAEEALRNSEGQYRTLFESIDEGFCVIQMLFDEHGAPVDYRFLEINPAFARHTGFVDAIGKTVRELVPLHDEFWFTTYGSVALTGNAARFESQARAMNRWFDVYCSRVGEPQERKVAIVFNDITERKLAELALKEADRRKDEFLATLSHELRNPLAPIVNAVHLLRDGEGEGQDDRELRRQAIAILERQVAHTVRLVDDLLDLSRITIGTIALDKEAIALAAIVDSAVETSRPHIEAEGHRLEIRMPAEPVMVLADPVRLAQVVANLLNNAAKYTPRGGRISVSAQRDGSDAVVTVRDNGAGIPAARLERVFDSFAEIDADLQRAKGGLGVGLSLARKLIGLHRGSIEARSEGPGRGSEFVVRLPLLAASEEPLREAAASKRAAPPSRRVLVVDDNVDAAESLGLLLRNMGHAVRLAHTGRAAIEAARNHVPEIVLLDLGLPELDGYGVAEALRKDRRFDAVRVIALTGYGQDRDRTRSRESGFDEHLLKPVDPESLRAALRRAGAGR